ncbi:hypothetical protein MOTT27_02715 [Mycobacterium intracellulare subsp. yongonense]|nr:hypothetical protein MOTT27_02715 [Mycobacterium intracellulare subsp. yongonense]
MALHNHCESTPRLLQVAGGGAAARTQQGGDRFRGVVEAW